MLLTITLSSGGRGPPKPIHRLSILKWSPRSPGPVSWVRCTNVKAVLHHWGLILRAWHRHPSYCANSEPRSHPGHSLFHWRSHSHTSAKFLYWENSVCMSFCNQSPNRTCPFLWCPPPLFKPLSALGRVASVIPQPVYSHSLCSPSSLVSVQQAGWSSKGHHIKTIFPHLTPTYTREMLSLKGNHTSLWMGHTLERAGGRGKESDVGKN